ncbi:hypothetical protein MAR_001480 [Mya arenaria]|uniref:Uncharacterized protein n=1 Tax=Mya arenaria TaxID=6604 RepID=A0ABY7FBX0_MYAAR|nr:hypothetical protein MAR_001480 [Mya arenaria]
MLFVCLSVCLGATTGKGFTEYKYAKERNSLEEKERIYADNNDFSNAKSLSEPDTTFHRPVPSNWFSLQFGHQRFTPC